MRYALFADVHGNLPALETFVRATRGKVDAYVCLGDVVNYGPWGNECVTMVRSLPGSIYLEGNHERLFLGVEDVAHEIPLVKAFYEHSRPLFTMESSIRDLPREHQLGPFVCTHTIDGNRRIYADSPVSITANYIIGHSHHQFHRQCDGFQLVNCGSIGQNRGYIDLVQYAIFDAEHSSISLHSEPYPVDAFVAELEVRGYPGECIAYLRNKKRFRAV